MYRICQLKIYVIKGFYGLTYKKPVAGGPFLTG